MAEASTSKDGGWRAVLERFEQHTPAVETSGFIEDLKGLARRIRPKSIAVSKRAPEAKKPNGYVDGAIARAHVPTARVMAKAKLSR